MDSKKYSYDLKLMVVREYLEGHQGIRSLAKKYGIQSKSSVGRWIKLYEKFGTAGLKSMQGKETYPIQFKLDVLRFMKRTGSSETDTAIHFGLKNPTIISSWKKALREGSAGVLDKQKGRIQMSDASKHIKNNQTNKKELTKEELIRENESLKIEVEYLKKLRAFRMDPESYLEKHKQLYHSNSKKNSDSN